MAELHAVRAECSLCPDCPLARLEVGLWFQLELPALQ